MLIVGSKQLFIHPVKSLLPVEVSSAVITRTGFRYDRQFILIEDLEVEDKGISKHLTIKTTSELCLFRQHINEERAELDITYQLGAKCDTITISLDPPSSILTNAAVYKVEIFGSQAEGHDMGREAQDFFSTHLNLPTRLLFIKEDRMREIPAPSLIPSKPSRFPWLFNDQFHPQKIHFADAAPLLVTTSASEHDARSRLSTADQEEDIILRFRPNIHVGPDNAVQDELLPYAEDNWKQLAIRTAKDQTVFLDCVFRTVRCQSLNVDFQTGKLLPPERQLYKLLTKDRRVNPAFPAKPCFGVYCFAEPADGTATVKVGDEVTIVKVQG